MNETESSSSQKQSIPPPKYPDNFPEIISDFTTDLTITFTEYKHLLSKWSNMKSANSDAEKTDIQHLFEYCLLVYPERFFDILYQNEEIFLPESTTNTFFLPEVDFRKLYHCPDVSENTRKTLWKYLQLLLITIMTSINNKTSFGESANLFDGINENELQTKLTETIENLSSFFKDIIPGNTENPTGDFDDGASEDSDIPDLVDESDTPKTPKTHKPSKSKDIFDNLPNPADIHEKLKGLFDGKIGNLAKELAEELTDDFMDILSEDDRADMKNVKNTGDVLKKLMKNPGKIMELMKSVGNKLNSKMKSGDISQEEIMKEASEMIGKMKDMGGDGSDMNDILKNLMKNMGGMAGFPGMGGKNAKMNTAAMGQMSKRQAQVEKMRQRMLAKRGNQTGLSSAATTAPPAPTQLPADYLDGNVKFVLEPTQNGSGNLSFKLPDEDGVQEKSKINPVGHHISVAEEEPDLSWINDTVVPPTNTKKTKSKKSKSKK